MGEYYIQFDIPKGMNIEGYDEIWTSEALVLGAMEEMDLGIIEISNAEEPVIITDNEGDNLPDTGGIMALPFAIYLLTAFIIEKRIRTQDLVIEKA